MDSLLNPQRPPAFCPGCSHEKSLHALDLAFKEMGLKPGDIAIVSDIGCSGLFDTFFNTHAFHGLHGRALTYAAGIKLAQPHLKVVVTMGDGGLGIGGAHLLAACRRNLDLTLLILNNFNFGMTGGQFSCTTPSDATVASGFLNRLEKPMDVCSVAASAGAPFVARCSVYRKNLARSLVEAIEFNGFSLVDIWGICTGRYVRRNPLSPRDIEKRIVELPSFSGLVSANARAEYGNGYREQSGYRGESSLGWTGMEAVFSPRVRERREIVLLGAAGDRIISAGTILAHAAILAGMQVTQKNDYDITVMRGASLSELIISPKPILYTGVERPDAIIALAKEGVERCRELFSKMAPDGWVILQKGVEIPPTSARKKEIHFKDYSMSTKERALAAVALLARMQDPISVEMLEAALRHTLKEKALEEALGIVARAAAIMDDVD